MVEPVPFSEPPWLNGHPSPYYSEGHKEWQRFCRKFMQENYAPYAMQWENEGAVPEHVYGKHPYTAHNQRRRRLIVQQANGAERTCSFHRSRRRCPSPG